MGYLFDVARNNFWRTANGKDGLPQLMWHITNVCGLRCKFCFSKKEPVELDITELQDYIKRFKQLTVQKIDISGGEPLTYLYLADVCDALCEAGIYITLTTRGIGRKENIDWILDNRNKFVRLIVSADVPTSGLFSKLSGEPNDFDEMQQLICSLNKLGYKGLRINTVVTKALLDKDIAVEMINWIKKSGCHEWCLIEPHPANKKKTFEEVVVKRIEFEQICSQIMKNMGGECKCKVLVRNACNFSGYWVIYPDGILAKHSEGENDTNEMDFLSVDLTEILRKINENKLWIPEEEK